MKIKLLLILIAFLFLSCAGIQYDANTGNFAYNRFGSQEIQGLRVEKDLSGVTVILDSQKSEIEIAKVLRDAIQTIDRAVKVIEEIQKKFPGLF